MSEAEPSPDRQARAPARELPPDPAARLGRDEQRLPGRPRGVGQRRRGQGPAPDPGQEPDAAPAVPPRGQERRGPGPPEHRRDLRPGLRPGAALPGPRIRRGAATSTTGSGSTGRSAADEAVRFIREVAEGLRYAAGRGMIHRDVKPANLLMTPDGHAKIIDLGLALQTEDEDERVTRDGTTVGTVDYMAPEQARDSRQTSERSDIYSLGCTFYYLLTGSPPYPGGGAGRQARPPLQGPDPRRPRADPPGGLRVALAPDPPDDGEEARAAVRRLHELIAALDALADPAEAPDRPRPTLDALIDDEDDGDERDRAGADRTTPRAPVRPRSPAIVARGRPTAAERPRRRSPSRIWATSASLADLAALDADDPARPPGRADRLGGRRPAPGAAPDAEIDEDDDRGRIEEVGRAAVRGRGRGRAVRPRGPGSRVFAAVGLAIGLAAVLLVVGMRMSVTGTPTPDAEVAVEPRPPRSPSLRPATTPAAARRGQAGDPPGRDRGDRRPPPPRPGLGRAGRRRPGPRGRARPLAKTLARVLPDWTRVARRPSRAGSSSGGPGRGRGEVVATIREAIGNAEPSRWPTRARSSRTRSRSPPNRGGSWPARIPADHRRSSRPVSGPIPTASSPGQRGEAGPGRDRPDRQGERLPQIRRPLSLRRVVPDAPRLQRDRGQPGLPAVRDDPDWRPSAGEDAGGVARLAGRHAVAQLLGNHNPGRRGRRGRGGDPLRDARRERPAGGAGRTGDRPGGCRRSGASSPRKGRSSGRRRSGRLRGPRRGGRRSASPSRRSRG